MCFFNWLETAIRQRMPVSLGADQFRDALGELGSAYADDPCGPIKDPVDGWMHVVACTVINPAACHLTFVVQADGVGIFSGEQVFEIASEQWPNPCDDLPVVFDRVCTDHIRIQWDRLPTHAEYLKHQIDSGFCQPRDVISRLERLGRLRDAGVVTADEFETHKRRILDEDSVASR